ncbi:MAG: 4Fe-4S binding protein [Gemmataceae bacterium]|nr:4Fe-4S binding protein [Gemmataceae bacterium]
MAYTIDLTPCINCGLCRRACPTECIHYFTTGKRTHVIDPARCIDCGLCAQVCPVDCIAKDPEYVHDPIVLAEAKAYAKSWARRRYEREQAAKRTAKETARRLAAART